MPYTFKPVKPKIIYFSNLKVLDNGNYSSNDKFIINIKCKDSELIHHCGGMLKTLINIFKPSQSDIILLPNLGITVLNGK